ncbi:MAG TPA: peptide chain release factor 2 [Spirochaetota bacterium]|nr:peptide chain release factor 2 [Spirochaetota bacterium]HRZ28495.1 peptide chain release factor 2 [Spirochaetota bacterium]
MRDYRDYQRQLREIKAKADEMFRSIDIAGMKSRLDELEKETMSANFWQDKERFALVNQEISRLKKKIEPWEALMRDLSEAGEFMEMALAEEDDDMLNDLCVRIESFRKTFGTLETVELFSGDDDMKNCFMSIHPGAGGTESQDWASMLFRMYARWAEQKGLEIDVIDYTPGEEAGIKSATMLVKGDYSYGYLKGEKGIHRLVRISPFDANKRRHTSFASVDVMPEAPEEIEIEIREADLKIDTYRASGAGGQHVNRTDSAVRLTHLPTGLVVQCQNERSQHKNKAFAMKVLKARLYNLQKKERDEKMQELAGEKKDIAWGNQIRSYVFQPYTLVKDHRTGEETGSVEHVFDGDIDRFIYAYLKTQRPAQ